METVDQRSWDRENDDKVAPDATITRRLEIKRSGGEHSLNLVVVVEDFRIGFYILFLMIVASGLILTRSFVDDPDYILLQVYGTSNVCSLFDYPPATYVLPALWVFPMLSLIMYSIAAVFRIWIAYLERKLSRREFLLLIVVYVYCVLSIIFFSMIFAVQPDPEDPVTMLIHTVPYINLKLMFAVLQGAIVYFGINVSWVGMNLPTWFHTGSVVHVWALFIVNILACIWLINAVGDTGESLEGNGLFWSVRSEWSKVSSSWIGSYIGFPLAIIVPLVQAIYISKRGVDSHTLTISVVDSRVSAYVPKLDQGSGSVTNL